MSSSDLSEARSESQHGPQTDDGCAATGAGAGPRVLVVEDNLNILELVTRALTFAGYGVEQAHDAQTAEQAAADHPPDALVMDVMLPGADGFTFVQRLRRHGLHRPVLYITALELDDDRVQAITCEGGGYLRKPFGVSDLLDALATLLAAAGRSGQQRGGSGAKA